MRNSLPFLLLVIFALLFAQLGGLTHGISHVLDEYSRSGDQSLSEEGCDHCDVYGQLDSPINVGMLDFTPLIVSGETTQPRAVAFRHIRILAAAARDSPVVLQRTA